MFGTKSLIKEVKRKGYNTVSEEDWEPIRIGDVLKLGDNREVEITGELGKNFKLQPLSGPVFLSNKTQISDNVVELYRKDPITENKSVK